jgi:hypothetical protein
MKTATIDVGSEHSRHFDQIYQEYYAGLRYNFLAQLGDASEADACTRETISRFFVFMKGQCWETEAGHIPAHLLDIAGLLCSEKLAAGDARRKNRLGLDKADGMLHKIIDGMIQPVRERMVSVISFAGRVAPTAARG